MQKLLEAKVAGLIKKRNEIIAQLKGIPATALFTPETAKLGKELTEVNAKSDIIDEILEDMHLGRVEGRTLEIPELTPKEGDLPEDYKVVLNAKEYSNQITILTDPEGVMTDLGNGVIIPAWQFSFRGIQFQQYSEFYHALIHKRVIEIGLTVKHTRTKDGYLAVVETELNHSNTSRKPAQVTEGAVKGGL